MIWSGKHKGCSNFSVEEVSLELAYAIQKIPSSPSPSTSAFLKAATKIGKNRYANNHLILAQIKIGKKFFFILVISFSCSTFCYCSSSLASSSCIALLVLHALASLCSSHSPFHHHHSPHHLKVKNTIKKVCQLQGPYNKRWSHKGHQFSQSKKNIFQKKLFETLELKQKRNFGTYPEVYQNHFGNFGFDQLSAAGSRMSPCFSQSSETGSGMSPSPGERVR